MNNTVKLGYAEAVAMTMIVMGSKSFLGFPRYAAEAGGTAGWMIIVIGGITAALFWLVVCKLLERFPGQSLAAINEQVFGPAIGCALNSIYIVSFLLRSAILLRLFSEAVIITALPAAPLSSLAVLFIVPVMFAVYQGLEAVSRSSYISLPFILAGVLTVLLLLYTFWDINLLLPLFGNGIKEVLTAGMLGMYSYSEVVILAFFAPYLSFNARKIRTAGLVSIAAVFVFFLLIVTVYLMVIPVPSAVENLAPFYQLSRTITFGRFFQRVEAVFILFWTLTAFLYQAIGVLLISLVMKQSLKLPYYHPLLPALTALLLAVALTPKDIISAIQADKIFGTVLGSVFSFILPCVIYGAALLRGKGGGRNGTENN